MATFKKTAKKTAGRRQASADAPAAGERLSKSISESAQQIWLAGVGALGKAQIEGSRLFEGLVREGASLERNARDVAGGSAEVVRDAVEAGVGQARERATDTWDRLEKVFEDRVQRAMVKLGVPGRADLRDLSARVDALTAELRRQNRPVRKTASSARGAADAAKGPAAKKVPRKAPRKAPATTAGGAASAE